MYVSVYILFCALILISTIFCRQLLDAYRNIDELGDAEDFFNSFQWTDQAFRDIEAVNLNGFHFILCGAEVL